MKLSLAIVAALFLFTSISQADLQVTNPAVRTEMIRNAKVWLSPSWISADFKFSPELNVAAGPAVKGNTQLLLNDVVQCTALQEDQSGSFGGKTAKFYCQLLGLDLTPLVKASGKPEKIKVKYSPAGETNEEIYGEILGTRLLWALGFAADQMFYVKQVYCRGCTANPYREREIDASSMTTPRLFTPTAIEKKFSGEDVTYLEEKTENSGPRGMPVKKMVVAEGVSFKEMMRNLPADQQQASAQYQQRDALRLLAVFMQHKDIKPENSRLSCPDVDAAGKCVGQPVMMIQDIGTSFGVGVKSLHFYKVNLEKFKESIWKNAATCQANLSTPFIGDGSMSSPIISEVGRKFLANLLQGFISGPEGQERVRDLFRAAHIEERGRGETVDQWANAFIAKANEVIYPMGAANPNFACPK